MKALRDFLRGLRDGLVPDSWYKLGEFLAPVLVGLVCLAGVFLLVFHTVRHAIRTLS